MRNLPDMNCTPVDVSRVYALTPRDVDHYMRELPGWEAVDYSYICKSFPCRNFQLALAFVNAIGDIANSENHYPHIFLSPSEVRVELWTREIIALTENDFILAAKIERAFRM